MTTNFIPFQQSSNSPTKQRQGLYLLLSTTSPTVLLCAIGELARGVVELAVDVVHLGHTLHHVANALLQRRRGRGCSHAWFEARG